MNDLETRLAQYLTDTADSAEPTPDLASVVEEAGIGEMHPPATVPRSRRSPLPAIAAAAILIAGGAAVITSMNYRAPTAPGQPPAAADGTATSPTVWTVPPGPRPSRPTLFPVVDSPPAGLTEEARILRAGTIPNRTTGARVFIGQPTGNGGYTDVIDVSVASSPPTCDADDGHDDDYDTDTTVLGQPARVSDLSDPVASRSVVRWGTGPCFAATGPSPMDLLGQLAPGAITATAATDVDQPPQLAIHSLPDGYEVVPHGVGVWNKTDLIALLFFGDGQYSLVVGAFDPLVTTVFDEIHPVSINGAPAWWSSFSGENLALTWQANDATFVQLQVGAGVSEADAITFASGLTYVDLDTWKSRYQPKVTTVSCEFTLDSCTQTEATASDTSD